MPEEEDDDATPIFNALPSVMFVGLDDELTEACMKGCDPVLVLKVAHTAAALQRMVSTHPLLLILGASVTAANEEAIRSHATAIGADVILQNELQRDELDQQIRVAVRQAIRARSLRSM